MTEYLSDPERARLLCGALSALAVLCWSADAVVELWRRWAPVPKVRVRRR